jgi:hypothetical protein
MKIKGDWAEVTVRNFLRLCGFPWCERTRAGYERDHGDLHLIPGVIAQVKNVRTPVWGEWLEQLAEQVSNAGADVGFLVWKRPRVGEARAGEWLAVMTLEQMALLLRRAGYGDSFPVEDIA